MKYIIFGGFDYAVLHEMDSDAVLLGIDYFVDNDPALIGTTYLGKEIRHPDVLLGENKNDMLILIGSIVYRAEISHQLVDMGFEEGKHFIWGIAFNGDDKCSRLWRHIEWNDSVNNASSLQAVEEGESHLARLKVAARLIDREKFNTLIDMGAANERVREFIPQDIRYIPVDYIRYYDSTVLCDLNKYEFPLHIGGSWGKGYDPEATCILSVGNLCYASDWRWYLSTIAENCATLILGHSDFVKMNREFRILHWTHQNALFDYEIILYMQKLGFTLTDAADFRLKATVYKFEKNRG